MKQFDVCRNPAGSGQYPYIIVLQSELIRTTGTQVVAPLDRSKHYDQGLRLYPEVDIEGERWLIILPYMSSVREGQIGETVASAAENRMEIIAAIDRLFTGF